MTLRNGHHLFCFGLSYSARALIRRVPSSDWISTGTVRGHDKAAALEKEGIRAVTWSGGALKQEAREHLDRASHVLISVPPGEDGDPAFHAAKDILPDLPDLKWIGYLSTTGVYGDTGGAVVDETASLNPSSRRSERRVEAERDWLSLFEQHGLAVHVFRLAGIYGPGRSAFDTVRGGQARRIDKPGHAFSRIHVDDIAEILAASIARPSPGEIYNVCDNEAAPPAEVTAYACDLLDVDPPPLVDFATAEKSMSPMALSFWNDNRRVSNRKIREDLGVTLHYPDYRAGLSAIFETDVPT